MVSETPIAFGGGAGDINGDGVPDIVLGLHRSLASRVSALAGRMKDGREVFMSGGVALNRAMADALAAEIGAPITAATASVATLSSGEPMATVILLPFVATGKA